MVLITSNAQFILTVDESWDVVSTAAPITYTLVNPALLRAVTVRKGRRLSLRRWKWLLGENQ